MDGIDNNAGSSVESSRPYAVRLTRCVLQESVTLQSIVVHKADEIFILIIEPFKKSKIENDRGEVVEQKKEKKSSVGTCPYYKLKYANGQDPNINYDPNHTETLRSLQSFTLKSTVTKPDTSKPVRTRNAKKKAVEEMPADEEDPNTISLSQAVAYIGQPTPTVTYSNVGGGFIVIDEPPPELFPMAPSENLRMTGADKKQKISQYDLMKDSDNKNKQFCPVSSNFSFKPIAYRACDQQGKIIEEDPNLYIFTGKMANLGRVFMRLTDLQVRLGIGGALQYWKDWSNVNNAKTSGAFTPPFPIWDADGTYLKDFGALKWSYFILPQDLADPNTAGQQLIRYCELAQAACFIPAETGGMPWRYWNKAADTMPKTSTKQDIAPTAPIAVDPVTLYFECFEHLIFNGWKDRFDECVKTAIKKSRFNPGFQALESTDAFFDDKTLVKIGVHPLGLFETYVTRTDMTAMLAMNDKKPIQMDDVPFPLEPAVAKALKQPSKVTSTHAKIKKPEAAESIPQPDANAIEQEDEEEDPPGENDTVTEISTNKLAAARNRERKPGQDDVMGLSAFQVSENLWTKNEREAIGIEGGGDVEWLHRSAFSFGRLKHGQTGTPQTPRNLVWGTGQVNTAMIRAESFIKRVARRTNSTVTLTTSLTYTEAPVDTTWMRPYPWMAPVLTYKFSGKGEKLADPGANSKETAIFDFNNIVEFMPFERLMPNYLEYFLDTEVEKLIFPWEVTKEQAALEAFIESGVDDDDSKKAGEAGPGTA
ncbi:hypothetical protein SISNIDRAFT_467076 [Sistotremastrum niveocremeum HHB9708]|uniref:Uncharacterized protein n=1 Tax=Sistotremastrum niveocremeum HHB9708 TaxID=1314777 RepID=A0A164TB03_9AGAM|nr:hypothetical protein SISNIDRAFT_467076 [Sistotremastrum niveocremeum HHB9708]